LNLVAYLGGCGGSKGSQFGRMG